MTLSEKRKGFIYGFAVGTVLVGVVMLRENQTLKVNLLAGTIEISGVARQTAAIAEAAGHEAAKAYAEALRPPSSTP